MTCAIVASSKSQTDIVVFRGFANAGKYDWSPFVDKLEFRLRLGGLSYHIQPGSFLKAPRGKIPYIAISEKNHEGELQTPITLAADTALVSKDFVERGLLKDLNVQLSLSERAQDLALRALLEDKLYFYQVGLEPDHTCSQQWPTSIQNHEIWIQNFYIMRPKVLSAFPYPLQVFVGLIIYRKMRQALDGQGTLRFSPDEIGSFKREIWESINELLSVSKKQQRIGGTPFWMLGGEEPTEADTTLFGFVSAALVCEAWVFESSCRIRRVKSWIVLSWLNA